MTDRSVKICFIAPSSYYLFTNPEKARFTGVDLDLFMTGRELATQPGCSVSFIVGDFGQRQRKTVGTITLFKSVAVKQRNMLSGLGSLWRYVQAFRQADADVYIASGAGYEIGLFALLSKIYKKQFIYRTASLVDCNGEWARRNGLRGRVYEWGLCRADRIITCAQSHVPLLREHYDLESQYVPTIYKPFSQKKRASVADILWVSTCYPLKRPELVVELAKALPDKKITMIMPRSDHYLEYYNEVINKIQAQENITYIEKVPVNEIDAYYAASRLFINTSEYEGFPIALLQALTQGTPSAFLSVDPDNVIAQQQLGVYASSSMDSFISGVGDLLNDSLLLKKYNAACRKYIADHHNLKSVARTWATLVRGLI